MILRYGILEKRQLYIFISYVYEAVFRFSKCTEGDTRGMFKKGYFILV